jgi:hypothetical protein
MYWCLTTLETVISNVHFNREQILSMKNENKQNIVDTLSSMPCALEADDVTDFCSLAQYYALKTPGSFRKVRLVSLNDIICSFFISVNSTLQFS